MGQVREEVAAAARPGNAAQGNVVAGEGQRTEDLSLPMGAFGVLPTNVLAAVLCYLEPTDLVRDAHRHDLPTRV